MFKDYFGKNAYLANKKLWLFDLDGTIYKDDVPLNGVLELLKLIKDNGGRYVFITNNSSCSVSDYIKKINKLGIAASEDHFFTSTQATIVWLKNNYPASKVYCQGTSSFVSELSAAGINVSEKSDQVDVVLVGFDTELTFEKCKKTCEILSRQDVVYIATNPDLVCPTSFGFIPDCGSICGMIENATGKTPLFLGKPEPVMINMVIEKFGYNSDDSVVVGDRLYTDIASGINAGVTSICVLTGETSVEDIKNTTYTPSYTFSDLNAVYNVVREQISSRDVISARSKKIYHDVNRCIDSLNEDDERKGVRLVNNLIAEYSIVCCAENWKDALKYIKDQLMLAGRYL